LDFTNKNFVFSNAGHNPPLLVNADGTYRFVKYGDMPLGMFQNLRYHQHYISLESGQILVLYTDGIIEGENSEGEDYGKERFAESVLSGKDLPAKDLINHIRKSIADFTERKFLDDDGTLFIVKAL
jgi:phosphoserine phosphatase RsbU/P